MGCFNRLEVGYWVYEGHLAKEPAGRVVEIQVVEGKYSDYDENPEDAEVTAIVIEKMDTDLDEMDTGELVTIPADEWMADEWCW